MKEIKLITKTKWEKWRAKTFYTKEPETIAWIKDFEDDCVFWDIGANIGIYSLFCAAMHPVATIHAFEPFRANYLRLWQNIWQNNVLNITAHYLSIGDYTGNCSFEFGNTMTGSSGGQAAKDLFKESENSYLMPMATADDALRFADIPNYIKIDTDGNEYDILGAMGTILSSHQLRSILVEINTDSDNINLLLAYHDFVPDDEYNQLKDRKSDNNMIFRRA